MSEVTSVWMHYVVPSELVGCTGFQAAMKVFGVPGAIRSLDESANFKSTVPPVSSATDDTANRKPHILRRLYDWTVRWAERPSGAWALFFIAVIESSVFPVPPDVLLIALAVGAPKRALRFAAICSIGSVLGGTIGYAIGWGAWHVVKGFFIPYIFSQAAFDRVAELYQGNAFVAILTAAFTPIPYKVFTIAAGVFGVNFWTLVFASLIGRSGRFFAVGGLIYIFGPTVKTFIEKYFDWLAWALLALAIAGFVAIKYLK